MEILANILRPTKLSDIVGQDHLIGKDKILTNLVKNKKIFSMILYGRPGTGKTSIAYAISNELDIKTRFLNAVVNNKSDFDTVIEEARMYGELLLIVDEIHRMNKDKQDILLPHIESGLIILIGLTTSNPYHSINPAIRSRCQIFELHNIDNTSIIKILKKASKKLDNITINNECYNYIANISSGDVRSALNLLEVSYYSTVDHNITMDILKNINNKPIFIHDKNEDGYYDCISALQKSIRGSDVDASIHYLARLIKAGDLDIIVRRLSVIAYEDIGLANPGIGPRLDASINAALRVGLPEASIILAEIVIEMALSPKSNSTYLALSRAMNDLNNIDCGYVPKHLHTNSLLYLYPHDYKNDWVKQDYLPDKLLNRKYYIKKNNNIENNLNKVYEEMKK
jgi:putative ATPase